MFHKQVSRDGRLEGHKICSWPEKVYPCLRDFCTGFTVLGCLWLVSWAGAWCLRQGCREAGPLDSSLPVAPRNAQSLGLPLNLLQNWRVTATPVWRAHRSLLLLTSAVTAPVLQQLPLPPHSARGRASHLSFTFSVINMSSRKESDTPVHTEREITDDV